MIPRQTFLFFLGNHLGQAYYLDANGNVATGSLASGIDYSLPEAPIGWLEQELTWARNQKYYGFFRAFSPDLKFVKNSATIIRKLFYLGKGIEQQIYFIATKWNPANGIYELYYKAELDLTQIPEDDPLTGITVKTMEGGVLKLFKAYENTIFEIPCDGSIPENKSVRIHGMMFHNTFNYELSTFAPANSGTIMPIIFTTEQGNDIGIAKDSQSIFSFDITDGPGVTAASKQSSYFMASVKDITITVNTTLQFGNSMTTGGLFLLLSDGTMQTIWTKDSIGNETDIISGTATIYAGTHGYLCFKCIGGNSAIVNGGTIQVSFDSQFDDTYTYVVQPADMFNILMQKICQQASEPGHNIQYYAQSSLLQQYSNLALTCGAALRNNVGAVIKISLSKLFNTYNPLLSACMGNQQIDTGLGEQLYFEDRETVYDSTTVDMELGEVAGLKIRPDENLLFGDLKIGYAEQKYDNKQGNNEVNTTAQYKSPSKKSKNEVNLICEARADMHGIEYTRFLVGTTNTSNNKSDNDIFLLNCDFSRHTGTEVDISGDLSQAITHLYPYKNGTFGLIVDQYLLNWPLIYSSIQGDSLANSFTIVNGNFSDLVNSGEKTYLNSKIQWNNTQSGFTTLNGTVTFSGNITGLIAIGSQIVGNVLSINLITSGIFMVRASLYKNNTEVQKALIPITIGKDFNISFDFSTNVYFGDNLYIDWVLNDALNVGGIYFLNINGQVREVLPRGLVGRFTKVDIALSSTNEVPIYSVKRVTYDEIETNILHPELIYNIEDLTPSRMFTKHGKWFRSVFYNMVDRYFRFQTTDKNRSLYTQKDGIAYTEGSDFPVSSLDPNIMFYPYIVEFDTEVPLTFTALMNRAINAHIHFTYYGTDFYFFPTEVKVKPALNDKQHWKGLLSPKTNLNDILQIDRNGINPLNSVNMGAFISHLSPVKFYPANTTQDARYNFKHMDSDFFINQVDFYVSKRDYYQKWQTNDVINLQIFSKNLGPAKIDVYNDKKVLINTYDFTQVTSPAVNSPNMLFELSINLSTFSEGVYYMVASIGVGGSVAQFISEGIHIKQYWPVTLLLEYQNSFNRSYMYFDTGFSPSFRVDGWIDKYQAKSHQTMFEDQPGDMKALMAIPYGTLRLNIGKDDGVPPYVLRLCELIMGLDSVKIDGLEFTKAAEDIEWEHIDVQGWAKKYHTLEIRPAKNEFGVSAIAEGEIEQEIVSALTVDTALFGEAVTGQNLVVIKKVE